MKKLQFEDRQVQKERTHSLEGKVIFARDFVTDKGSIPGVVMQLDNCPYKLRALQNSIKGAGNAATLMNCNVKIDGDLREYEGKQYLTPRDVVVTRQSNIAKMAAYGISFAGNLD